MIDASSERKMVNEKPNETMTRLEIVTIRIGRSNHMII